MVDHSQCWQPHLQRLQQKHLAGAAKVRPEYALEPCRREIAIRWMSESSYSNQLPRRKQ